MSTARKKRTGSRIHGAVTGREGSAGEQARRKSCLRIIPLGGLGEIGKNITAIEYGDDIIIIDCGLKFPEEEMLGIDFVVPDTAYLVENKRRIRGVFLTHGHEDHIGAVPLVIPRIESPIYGTALTLALVESKMEDARVSYRPDYRQVKAGQVVDAGCFKVGFIRVSHSIPDSLAIYVRTPVGVVLHSGDFKMDLSPLADMGTDLSALAELGRDGVLLLLSDSTNSEREGFTPSEFTVGRTFEEIFRLHKDRRIVIAAFASNLYRAQQVFNTASRFNRRVMLVGRSMLSYVELAQKLGYVDVPEGLLVTSSEAETIAPNRMVVLTTGSQGEPFSGLVLMSKSAHRQIRLGARDLVVISASPIPGNEKLVSNTVNRLFACGCEVIYEKSSAIHVSGHASKEEQKILLSVVKPKYFMPVHGEYRHLVRHGQLAKEMGIPAKNVFIMQNGDALMIEHDGRAKLGERVQSGAILVDGMMLGEFEGSLLRERKELSESGLITISIVLNADYQLIAPVQTDSRGCIYGLDRDNMSPDVGLSVERAIDAVRSGSADREALPAEIRRRIREVLGRNFRTYPSILPLITIVGDGRQTNDEAPSRFAGKGRRGRPRGTRKSSAGAAKPGVS